MNIDFTLWGIETWKELQDFEAALNRFYWRRTGRNWDALEIRAYWAMKWNAAAARERLQAGVN